MKGQQLSPRKYIETRARTLPVYKCWASVGWQQAGMASVIVTRRHVNGNLTAGTYLVDLLCLGVKDTFFLFNESEDELKEKLHLNTRMFTEIDYTLAHNIIYAGYEFAKEFEIQPHKEFQTTKFMLEEDTDDIPLIEIHTGDKNGNPHLFVLPDNNYKPVLDKLKKNAGEGNYTFTIRISELDDLDVEEWNDDDDEEKEEEEWSLDDIEPDYLQFSDIKQATGEELDEAFVNGNRSVLDKQIISIEMILRSFGENDEAWDMPEEEIVETEDFQLYKDCPEFDENEKEKIDYEIRQVASEFGSYVEKGRELNEQEKAEFYSLFRKYIVKEFPGFVLLSLMPFSVLKEYWVEIRKQFSGYPLLVRLALLGIALAYPIEGLEEGIENALKNKTVNDAFPHQSVYYALHHKIFWSLKALAAMQQNNKKDLQYYHSLLTIADLPSGQLKLLYVTNLSDWLKKELEEISEREDN